jgi:hypothetical protein
MGYKEFPYEPSQKGWGILVTSPGTGTRALVGIFKDDTTAQLEAAARKRQKTVKNPRVVPWTEAQYNAVSFVYDMHFMFCEDRRVVDASEYRDPTGKPFDTYPTPDKSKPQYSGYKFYTDIRSMIIDGRSQSHLRSELRDHPANLLIVPPTVPLYTAKNNWAEDDYGKYVALIRVNGKEIPVDYSHTRNKLVDDLHFGVVYSNYRPSLFYRAFRTAYGYEETSKEYSTPELIKDGERRTFAAVAVMAGASNETVQKILKEDC